MHWRPRPYSRSFGVRVGGVVTHGVMVAKLELRALLYPVLNKYMLSGIIGISK